MRAFASLILAVLIFAAAGAPPAAAQLSQDWTRCENQGNAFSSDAAISGCTAFIQSGRESAVNRATAYINRGAEYHAKGDNDRAIADYTNAIRLNPKDVDAYNNRGFAYKAKGDNDRAMADYNHAIRLSPSYALAYTNRGLVFEALGRREEAIADFRRALANDPSRQDSKDGLKRLGASP